MRKVAVSRSSGRREDRSEEPKVAKVDQYFSRAVGKALEALDCISQSEEPPSLQEVARFLGLTKASAFRILHTLELLGYLEKTPDGRYSTRSRGVARVSTRILNQMIRCGSEFLERLSLEFRETASLGAVFDNHIEVLTVVESPQLIRMGNIPGQIVPPHASSLGKAITAFQSSDMRDKLVRSYGTGALTPNTLTDEIAIRAEFARIRELGYAEDRGETIIGGRCFAAPIFGTNGAAVGGVSLSMPEMRLKSEEQRLEIVASVRRTALEIQAQLA